MTIVLALAWRPDAETTPRFEQLYPAWQAIYHGVSIVTPPEIPADFGSGARGFSRAAVVHILAHDSVTSHPIVNDLGWPVLLHRAGFDVSTYESDAAYYTIESEAKRTVLEQPEQWQKRVRLAHAIIQAGIEAS